MPVHYYNKNLLHSLGNLVGKTVKIDVNTSSVQRGKFARVVVTLDLAKPLVPKIWLDGSWQRIEYEGLPKICFTCGRVGHSSASCSLKVDDSMGGKEGTSSNDIPNDGLPNTM